MNWRLFEVPGPKVTDLLKGVIIALIASLFFGGLIVIVPGPDEVANFTDVLAGVSGIVLSLVVVTWFLIVIHAPGAVDTSEPHSLFELYDYASNGFWVAVFATHVFGGLPYAGMIGGAVGVVVGVTMEEIRRRRGAPRSPLFLRAFGRVATLGAIGGVFVPFLDVGITALVAGSVGALASWRGSVFGIRSSKET